MLVLATRAQATYSIVAADTLTREVGGAGTSCLGGSDVRVIYGAVPGVGVVHAQAHYLSRARDEAVELLRAGENPPAVLAALLDPAFDADSRQRQYALVDVLGDTAAFTGPLADAVATSLQGQVGAFAYSVQGNLLTSPSVVERAAARFEASGCDLAERLLGALEAGALDGEGDRRCTNAGIPSDSAFLQVESPALPLGEYLALSVPTSGAQSPLPALRAEFEVWRSSHPCPAPISEAPAAQPPVADSAGCSCGVVRGAAHDNEIYLRLALIAALLLAVCRRRADASVGARRAGT